MKRRFLGLCALLLSTAAFAQTSHYLILQRLDGMEESLKIENGMKVSFEANAFNVTLNSANLFTFPLASLNSFAIDIKPTGIADAQTETSAFSQGAPVEVFNLHGQKVATYRQGLGGEPQLSPGLYIFRSEGKSFKQLLP